MDPNGEFRNTSREQYNQIQSFEVSMKTNENDKAKGTFNNQIQFLLSALGFAVGYGNIWRFPYMLYKHGGGAFFIPYLSCLFFLVFPFYYMEVAFGQMYKKALHRYYDSIHPKLVGLSITVAMINFFLALFYMCLISWCFSFLINSFQDPLPWAPKLNEDGNISEFSSDYFIKEFLDKSDSMFDIRSYNPTIMFSFIAMMAFIFFSLYRGIHSAKYLTYVIVPLPYFILTVFFVKGLTLEGFSSGWAYLYKPDWSKLWTLSIWSDAAGQAFFSAGLAQNTVIKLASHRKDDEPLLSTAVLIPCLNFGTSLFASLALFSFIGHASYTSGIPIDDMNVRGMELSFVIYPALINTLPWPNLWSILFFTMMTMLGFGTEYVFIEVCSDTLHGICTRRKKYKGRKVMMTFKVCLIILIFNLVFFSSSAGYYWLEYVDHYSTSVNMVVFSFIQVILFVYFLPIKDLIEKIKKFGETTPKLYIFCLKYICPIFSLFLSAMAVYGDITRKNKPKETIDVIVCNIIFAIPLLSFLIVFVWNPFGRYDLENKAEYRSANLLDNGEEMKEASQSGDQ
ncbi:unnamed protein product [Moneuplotes crassus]|uniref:Transporter n=1 Tax=Euplotes crassus TaxID=5936 RepID=A0AAD1UCE8_EUPCR|nr:unnamed protein product [Moneuplotes crassus]